MILAGRCDDTDMVLLLGGNPARRLVGGAILTDQEYWLRVWGARGLLWAGAEGAHGVLRDALRDESWRVREMACKVVARHLVEELLDDVAALDQDSNARVRGAARRAVVRIVGSPP